MKKKWTNFVKNNEEIHRKIILASESPRRKAMLKDLNIAFQEYHSRIDEKITNSEDSKIIVTDLAIKKIKASPIKDRLVIGMDSLVVLGKNIMGKPQDENEAREMLKRLSGKKHYVITGIAVSFKNRIVSGTESTDVYFRKLKPDEIEWYISTGEPLDKAGAYAIQGLGRIYVRKINGCYFNVLGFPIFAFQKLLSRFGLTIYDLISTGGS
jgi:septum formation protein